MTKTIKNAWNYKNIISKAKMEHKSILVVEGIDDVKKFNIIKQSIDKKIEIKSIGSFENYYKKKGAKYVMDFIEKLIEFHQKNNSSDYIGYILGIVDRDSICYERKETKENNLLYVLDYYSLESFYVNKEVIEKTLSNLITNPDLIDENIVSSIYNEVISRSIENLYYISLEALKKSCDSSYSAIVGYKPDKIINFLNHDSLPSKENDLDIFARNKGLAKDIDTALKIIKGKWFISSFCDIYLEKIKELEELCKNGEIRQCDNCSIDEIYEPCLYKPRDVKLQEHNVEEMIFTLIDLDSLTPIKDRIKELK